MVKLPRSFFVFGLTGVIEHVADLGGESGNDSGVEECVETCEDHAADDNADDDFYSGVDIAFTGSGNMVKFL